MKVLDRVQQECTLPAELAFPGMEVQASKPAKFWKLLCGEGPFAPQEAFPCSDVGCPGYSFSALLTLHTFLPVILPVGFTL